ncbi:globin domain-containing protein [Actinoallomurus sp. NPDC050550]|uniref:globin domain-containing protein n=1 Tax=Actinoallomurus sp. NPDC050550 TaxID=3154937 RepID=UPI00341185EF
MSVDIALLRESWGLVSENQEKVASQFYGLLFSRYPQVRALFPAGMDSQRDRLVQALTYVVLNLEDSASVTAYLGELARDHRKFDVRPEHYPAVGRCLIASMRAVAGEAWRQEFSDAWLAAYELIATIMIQAAAQDETSSPPYWNARVIAHEQRSPETAVITVEPEQPYPFLAGQYATIQTARWPRIWRAYSIANAPSPDNHLTFHVRLIPAGWVSTTLVRQTSVGDRLMLGPPRGMMTLPSPVPERLLCLAGGTGLAPLKAIAEETLRTSSAADITLIHGVRRQADFYDVEDMTHLATAHGRLRLIAAVSDDPDHPPSRTVADVVGRDHVEAWPMTFVCGPPEMVLSTLDLLSRLGLPAHRIRSEPDAGQIMHRLRAHAPI